MTSVLAARLRTRLGRGPADVLRLTNDYRAAFYLQAAQVGPHPRAPCPPSLAADDHEATPPARSGAGKPHTHA